MELGLFSSKIQNTNKNTAQASTYFFYSFVISNGFVIYQYYTINSWMQRK